MPTAPLLLSTAFFLSLIALHAFGDVRIVPLVVAGDTVPGLPGVSVGAIETMHQDSLGRVIFTAQLEGAVTPETDGALLRYGDGIEVLLREGDPVPGQNATIRSIHDAEVSPGDHVLFTAYLSRGRTGGGWGAFMHSNAGLLLIADDLMEVPGRPSDVRFWQMPEVTAFDDGRVILGAATRASGSPSLHGVWVGPPGALVLLTPPGGQVPGMNAGILFSACFLVAASSESALLSGYVSGPGVSQSNDRCLWEYSAAGLRLVTRELDVLPGMIPPQYLADLGGPGDMHPTRGRFVFRGNLPGGQYRTGFWAGQVGALRRVVMAGQSAPHGSTFQTPAEAYISSGGEALFSSTMTGADGTEYAALWLSRPDGELTPVAQQYLAMPGLPDGYTLVQLGIAGSPLDLRHSRISASGRIAFWGLASGPGPLIRGLWTGDPDRGIELAIQNGTRFGQDAAGSDYAVDLIGAYALNNRDQLAVLVRTTDLQSAIVHVLPMCGDPACGAADVANADCRVDLADLAAVLSRFGDCGGLPEDMSSDGCVGIDDLVLVLANFGAACR